MGKAKRRKFITIHSRKGGVGKTSTAIALGFALAQKNYSICFVDFDIMGPSFEFIFDVQDVNNAYLDYFISRKRPYKPDIDVFLKNINLPGFKWAKNIRCVLSSPSPYHLINMDALKLNWETVEKRVLNFFSLLTAKGFDFIIIDNSPGLSRYSQLMYQLFLSDPNSIRIILTSTDVGDMAGLHYEQDMINDLHIGNTYWIINKIPVKPDSKQIVDYFNLMSHKILSNIPFTKLQNELEVRAFEKLSIPIGFDEIMKTWLSSLVSKKPNFEGFLTKSLLYKATVNMLTDKIL